MVYITLKKHGFKDVHATIDLKEKENTEIDIAGSCSLKVTYKEDNTACTAALKQTLQYEADPSKLNISVEGKGYFLCEGINSDEDKKEAYVMAYTLLFPYFQNLIARLTMDAGFPPLMIDMAKLDPNEITLEDDE